MQSQIFKHLSRLVVVACALSLPVLVAAQGKADDKPIKLKLASVSAPSGQVLDSDGVQWWMDRVTERTKGRVTFETFWGSSLAAPTAHLDILQKGLVDVILGCRIYTPGKTPLGPYHYVLPFGPTEGGIACMQTESGIDSGSACIVCLCTQVVSPARTAGNRPGALHATTEESPGKAPAIGCRSSSPA